MGSAPRKPLPSGNRASQYPPSEGRSGWSEGRCWRWSRTACNPHPSDFHLEALIREIANKHHLDERPSDTGGRSCTHPGRAVRGHSIHPR